MILNIIIDTREQTPWAFPADKAICERGTLSTGDYALKGDDNFSVERKSLQDFVGTVSTDWERFNAEIERMVYYPAAIVIVEGSFTDILNREYDHPEITPGFVFKRIAELAMMNVTVLLCDNPVSSAGMCYKILMERKKQIENS
ncbi:MAG: ERCC4 domain-containing protein [Smithella sp.]|jgi:ERCC4-type nuclease